SAPIAWAQATIQSTPSSNYSPYYPWYPNYYDFYGLQGASQVINAQGQLMVNQQDAFLKREQVRKARIENRRAEWEQFFWEREKLPTPEDDRERFAEEQLHHARFGADLTEVWSAKALNQLLADARRNPNPGPEAASAPPIGDDVLDKINVTSG